jgi:hypothetical protein
LLARTSENAAYPKLVKWTRKAPRTWESRLSEAKSEAKQRGARQVYNKRGTLEPAGEERNSVKPLGPFREARRVERGATR